VVPNFTELSQFGTAGVHYSSTVLVETKCGEGARLQTVFQVVLSGVLANCVQEMNWRSGPCMILIDFPWICIMMKPGQCVNDANGRTCEQIISWANFDDKQRICTVLDAQTVNFGYLVRYHESKRQLTGVFML
jgi:hypothetical protein